MLLSIQIGAPRWHGTPGDPADKPWLSGFFKDPIAGPIELDWTNLAGDGQADLENHGGVDKAVCAYSAEHYAGWRTELKPFLHGVEFVYGAFGENFTIAGLTEETICIGDVYSLGVARLQVSQPRQPCWKLARRWKLKDLTARVIANGKTGWYFRVLLPGVVEAGMPLELLERPRPEWTIARANDVMYREKKNPGPARELSTVPELSESWRDHLESRANQLEM
ncbi:MAG: MOSC domain-containing protein [Pirellulales bacterium]